MGLEESLAQLSTHVKDGDFSISITFNSLSRQFDEHNRMLILYSDIKYDTENFHWASTIPTVKIPYKDPSLGFLVDDVIFSSIGVYSRAPGIVPSVEKRTLSARTVEEPKIDIVNAKNSTISIGYKRNAVQIIFKRNAREYKVPIGIFLKALSGLPYGVILDKFAYKPQALLNAFPCEIPKGSEDLSRAATYGIESHDEPSIEDCVNMVYNAITQSRDDSKAVNYTSHWKLNRITSFFNNLHFKTRQKYEASMSVGNRAVGTYLDQDICIPYFKQDVQVTSRMSPTGKLIEQEKVVETVEEFKLPKGHYITDDDAREIRRYDIDTLRVRTTRSFVLQESTPMLFRAKGYKLCSDIPVIGATAGTIIDDDLLVKINDTSLGYLEVFTPGGRKVLHRSSESVELGDFYSILNYLFTHPYMQKTDATQYEVSNRIILDYNKQVRMEVEQTYSDIVSAVMGSTELKNLLDAFPSLPSTRLIGYLRNSRRKEITQSDITNVMSRAISESKASAGMRETPAAMMPVQKGQYGRLDSFHAPDSDKVGSVQQLTVLARVREETGEIEAPYERVVDGKPTGQIEYITAAKENNKYIAAWNCDFSTPMVLARCNGDITTIPRERVDYRDPSPFCDMSISRMCVPFPGFSQPKRALMATKMNGQAVPILFPERPRVSTGADTEVPALYYTGRQILEICAIPVVEGVELEIVGYEWRKNLVEYKFVFGERTFSFSVPFTATDKKSLYSYDLNLKGSNYSYGLDEVIFYNHSCDLNDYDYWTRVEQGAVPLVRDYTRPSMALGVNLNICYKTYGSTTVDDALVISDRLISDNTLSHIQIYRYTYKLKRGEDFSDVGWSPAVHSHIYAKQPVIKVVRANVGKGVAEKEVLCKQEGEVVYAHKDDKTREAEVWVSTLHHAEIGDKVAGRYGNKSVIAKIVPEWMMPYDPVSGITYDIVCTPLGLPSRMNLGQILEVALGGAMLKQSENGKQKVAICTPFYPNIKQEITEIYNQEGLKPIRIFNPIFGKMTERPVMTGVLYVMKLEQMSNTKLKACGYPQAVDPVFGQPVDSINRDKGQAIGEMESWALIASGAHTILDSFYGIYSGNEEGRRKYFELLANSADNEDDPWDESFREVKLPAGVNRNALVTQTVMRMFGCDLEVVDNRYVITPLVMEDIPVQVTPEEFTNGFERVKDFEWFTVKLAAPVINPFWVYNFPLHLVLDVKSVKTLANKKAYLDLNRINLREECVVSAGSLSEDEKITMLTGVEAIIELIKNTTVEDAIARIRMRYDSSSNMTTSGGGLADSDEPVVVSDVTVLEEGDDGEGQDLFGSLADVPMNAADVLRFLERMRRKGQELTSLIWYDMPIMPRIFRQANVVGDREHKHSFQQQLEGICSSRSTSQGIYEGLKQFIGYGTAKQEDLVSIRGYFFGRNAQAGQHGKVRGAVLSKRIGFSGRVVIVPMEDPTISPFFVGLPWRAVCIELAKPLSIRLVRRSTNIASHIHLNTGLPASSISALELSDWEAIVASLGEFNTYLLHKYFVNAEEGDLYFIYHYLRSIVKELVEGKVRNDGMVWWKGSWRDPMYLPENATIDCAMVITGRQPTLHKKSIRASFVKLVDGYCMRIHPIICKGYNADFDGDQMYHAQLFGECKVEACQTISVMQDLISEKDGSYTLELGQDVALGIYCATTYKDNVAFYENEKGNYFFFDGLDELRTQLEYGDLHYYDAVVYYDDTSNRYYLSTAGRVLINGNVPGGFTLKPFTDAHGIGKAVLDGAPLENFCELLYDDVWTTTGIRPAGRSKAVRIEDVMLDTYNAYGARKSIMTAQALYEIGVAASDVVSVSITLDDMSSPVDKQKYMEEPRKTVSKLNSLYQLGLITEENRKLATIHAWDSAKKAAQEEIIGSLDPNSNTYYMMYSGARGKPDQVMQSVGFIGTIAKTLQSDIEYPILHGYGEGLTSLDLSQTTYSARIGVISTQAGTKDTGYATRQSVYMTSGFVVRTDDCGIEMRYMSVDYDTSQLKICYPDGRIAPITDLLGEFVADETESFQLLKAELNRSGYMINDAILERISDYSLSSITLIERDGNVTVSVIYTIAASWRKKAVESLYSYALPFTDGMKITEQTVDWIEENGLREVIAFEEWEYEAKSYFDREAYLPVEYDTSRYTIYLADKKVDNEALYSLVVDTSSVGYHYYKNLVTSSGNLTEKALGYLTKKKIREIRFTDGSVATLSYAIADLFKDVVEGRISMGLLHLDDDSCITQETLKYIEQYQLDYIPVFTGMTCLAEGGICAKCYGKSLSSKEFMPVDSNLGIAASQAMCEPLSQATLNVAHAGGKRGSGTGLISGLSYYTRMLQGTMTTGRTESLKERFAECSGYVIQNPHNKAFVQIVDADGKYHTVMLDDSERLNVPDGAYVDVNDTIVSGLPDLHRYDSTDVFDAALKARYALIQEYDKIFNSLSVSARNTETLARAQTSICYLVGKSASAKVKDTGEEARNPTGQYKLTVSNQAQVVNWFTGIAGYGFEKVANMILMGLFTSEGLKLNSCLGNLITGTEVGSEEAKFIPKVGAFKATRYHKSKVRTAQEEVLGSERSGDYSAILKLDAASTKSLEGYSAESEEEILDLLAGANTLTTGLPEVTLGADSAEPETPEEISEEETVSTTVVQMEFESVGSDEEEIKPESLKNNQVYEVEYVSVEEEAPEPGDTEKDKEQGTGVRNMDLK